MVDNTELLDNPDFQKFLSRRSRWRWSLSGLLIGTYLAFAIGGIYFSDAYATPFMGSSIPWGIMVGFMIIAVSMVTSVVYVRMVNRLAAFEMRGQVIER